MEEDSRGPQNDDEEREIFRAVGPKERVRERERKRKREKYISQQATQPGETPHLTSIDLLSISVDQLKICEHI